MRPNAHAILPAPAGVGEEITDLVSNGLSIQSRVVGQFKVLFTLRRAEGTVKHQFVRPLGPSNGMWRAYPADQIPRKTGNQRKYSPYSKISRQLFCYFDN
jgi:hypothetical protein